MIAPRIVYVLKSTRPDGSHTYYSRERKQGVKHKRDATSFDSRALADALAAVPALAGLHILQITVEEYEVDAPGEVRK